MGEKKCIICKRAWQNFVLGLIKPEKPLGFFKIIMHITEIVCIWYNTSCTGFSIAVDIS